MISAITSHPKIATTQAIQRIDAAAPVDRRTAASIALLRIRDVCRVTALSRSTIYQLEAQQRFPRRVRVGLRAVGWVNSEVQAWLTERMSERPFRDLPPSESAPSTAAQPSRPPRAPATNGP